MQKLIAVSLILLSTTVLSEDIDVAMYDEAYETSYPVWEEYPTEWENTEDC